MSATYEIDHSIVQCSSVSVLYDICAQCCESCVDSTKTDVRRIARNFHKKSVNLQYNTLGCLDDGTNESPTKPLMFQVLFFFHNFLQNSLQKLFQFIFLFFYKFTKIKIKSFECPKSIRNYEKNNAWNIRHLVDESFGPSTQRIILQID